jgi:hypothetical protein
MEPTPKLRFVERDSYSHNGEHFATPHKVRILQQLWMPTNEPYGEWLKIKDGVWKDVPCERE